MIPHMICCGREYVHPLMSWMLRSLLHLIQCLAKAEPELDHNSCSALKRRPTLATFYNTFISLCWTADNTGRNRWDWSEWCRSAGASTIQLQAIECTRRNGKRALIGSSSVMTIYRVSFLMFAGGSSWHQQDAVSSTLCHVPSWLCSATSCKVEQTSPDWENRLNWQLYIATDSSGLFHYGESSEDQLLAHYSVEQPADTFDSDEYIKEALISLIFERSVTPIDGIYQSSQRELSTPSWHSSPLTDAGHNVLQQYPCKHVFLFLLALLHQ